MKRGGKLTVSRHPLRRWGDVEGACEALERRVTELEACEQDFREALERVAACSPVRPDDLRMAREAAKTALALWP